MRLAGIFDRLSGKPRPLDYVCALAVIAVAVLCRAALQLVAPGVAYFVFLLPAVVVAGVFWGTAPALLAAACGGIAIAGLFFGSSLAAWPPLNSTQLDTLMFLPACAAAVVATGALRRAVGKAAAAEARLAEVFRQIPGAAAILEAPDGRLLLRSSQSDAVLGQPERELATSDGLASYGGVHPDGRVFAPQDYPIVRALESGAVIRGERLLYRRPGGRLVHLEIHAGPVRDGRGEIVAAVGMAFDVSDRVEAGRRLEESEALHRDDAERLRAAVDAGGLGLWELDFATQRIRIDARLAAMLGLPGEPQEIAREAMARLVDPQDQERAGAVLAGAVASGAPYADELRIRTADGRQCWFVARGVHLPEARKIVGAFRDVTERRQREDALRAALEARDVLMHEADHRIKNSLQLVAALLRLQLGRVADPEARGGLEAAIARVDAVAQAHLALQSSQDLRSVPLDRMLGDLCGRVQQLNPAVTLRCHAEADLWLDAEQAIPLGLIASELLTNALRHAFAPGCAGTASLTASAAGGRLAMTIADDGAGLPATKPRAGLGSSVVAALARQIGAAVAISSAPGAGTTVTVTLPCRAADAEMPALPTKIAQGN
jgi:PAS domain S-box-containing protein